MDIVCVPCLRKRTQVIDWNSVEECVLQAGQVAGRRELVLGSRHNMPSFVHMSPIMYFILHLII